MSSAHKSTNAELVAIYRLEFYRQKKNWKLCQDVPKGKDSKEMKPSKTKPSKKKSASENEKPTKRLLNETYVVDKPVPVSGSIEVLLESDPGTNLAKEPKTQSIVETSTATKDEPKGWTNSSRNIALTNILKSQATPPNLPPNASSEELALMDVSTWPEPPDKPRKWTLDFGRGRPVKMWSEEFWQESCGKQQVFEPELWSPTREYQLACTRDKVWSKEDQIWPQSPTSWPEPVVWQGNELIWPAASQQQPVKKVDNTDAIWSVATHQEPEKSDGESKLLWAAMQQGPKVRPKKMVWCSLDDSHQQPVKALNDADIIWPTATHQEPAKPMGESELFRAAVGQHSQKGGLTKLVCPDDCQRRAGSSAVQWSSDSRGRERWDTIRGWTEDDPRQLEPALSPEVLVSTAEEWLHVSLAHHDDWLDSCLHGCVSRSMCEFTRGAHCREHSSEVDLSATRELDEAQPPAALSGAALCACVRRHASLLQTLLCETRARDQLSAELDDYAHRRYENSSYEEFPTRDVGLHGPRVPTKQFHRPPNQGPIYDDFISGSFLNDPCFDLESGSTINVSPRGACADVNEPASRQAPGRGRGRLLERVIGIGPGGRPYRL